MSISKICNIEYLQDKKILKMEFLRGSQINAEIATKLIEHASEVSLGEMHANLVDMRNMMFMSKEARNIFAESDKTNVACIAVILNSKFQKSLGNLYMRFNKPKIKTQMFYDKTKALEWIKNTLKEL